jgi:hypothetical protein
VFRQPLALGGTSRGQQRQGRELGRLSDTRWASFSRRRAAAAIFGSTGPSAENSLSRYCQLLAYSSLPNPEYRDICLSAMQLNAKEQMPTPGSLPRTFALAVCRLPPIHLHASAGTGTVPVYLHQKELRADHGSSEQRLQVALGSIRLLILCTAIRGIGAQWLGNVHDFYGGLASPVKSSGGHAGRLVP